MHGVPRIEQPKPLFEEVGELFSGTSEFAANRLETGLLRGHEARDIARYTDVGAEDHLDLAQFNEQITNEAGAGRIGDCAHVLETGKQSGPAEPFVLQEFREGYVELARGADWCGTPVEIVNRFPFRAHPHPPSETYDTASSTKAACSFSLFVSRQIGRRDFCYGYRL
jgi:hypothetical protein